MVPHDEYRLRSESIDLCLHETRIIAMDGLLASDPCRLSSRADSHIHCILANEEEPVIQTTRSDLPNALLRRPVRCAER